MAKKSLQCSFPPGPGKGPLRGSNKHPSNNPLFYQLRLTPYFLPQVSLVVYHIKHNDHQGPAASMIPIYCPQCVASSHFYPSCSSSVFVNFGSWITVIIPAISWYKTNFNLFLSSFLTPCTAKRSEKKKEGWEDSCKKPSIPLYSEHVELPNQHGIKNI